MDLFRKKSLETLLDELHGDNRLRRVLGPVGLTSLGVGAIIGAGIFALTGVAAHDKAGPGLVLSFVAAGLACVFSALCYAEFASMVPVAGSAYTYAYATMGELFAWIIGWDLVLEYSVSSATVANSWSSHFQDFLGSLGLRIPALVARAPVDYDPDRGFSATGAVIDLPSLVIVFVITVILVRGIRQSARFNIAMVSVKLAAVLFVILVGVFFINPDNWTPFAPFGYTGVSFFGHTVLGSTGQDGAPVGVLAGAAMIFFAYIGFDSVSTHAEEAKRPHRDVPIGIIASLLICTVLYIAVAAVLTGMVRYDQLDIKAPVADAFRQVGLPWAQRIIDVGAITGLTSVLLVMMLSQPRVLLAMARDGMVSERFFGAVHEKCRTPWKSTILTGAGVALMASLLPLRILAELTNIGTLFAFVMVCLAVLIMRRRRPDAARPFRAPFYPVTPVLGILICLLLMFSLPVENWYRLFIWLLIGFSVFFGYSRRHSKLGGR